MRARRPRTVNYTPRTYILPRTWRRDESTSCDYVSRPSAMFRDETSTAARPTRSGLERSQMNRGVGRSAGSSVLLERNEFPISRPPLRRFDASSRLGPQSLLLIPPIPHSVISLMTVLSHFFTGKFDRFRKIHQTSRTGRSRPLPGRDAVP